MHQRFSCGRFYRRSVLGRAALSLMAIAYAGLAKADTISGTLTADTTLTQAGSPWSVPGDLVVPSGITLTIEPGVTLTFASGPVTPNLGDQPTAEIVVLGALSAVGTPENPITFQSTTSTRASWGGIFLGGQNAVATVRYAVLTAPFGIRTWAPGALIQADHLSISNCTAGVHSIIGSVVLDSISVTNCFEGVGTVFTATFSASNLLVVNSLAEGIHSDGSGSMNITNATVFGGGTGVWGRGNLTLRNSIVTNTRTGIDGDSTTQVLHSNVFNNLTNYVGVTPGTGTISQDPLFVAAPTDLRLLQGSPCIDAGNPTNAPDHDLLGILRPLDGDAVNGAAFDMGAFEYVRPVLCGDGLVEGGEECDDGNNAPGDGCAADCTIEPFCGDGTLDDGEECDDGNNAPGDGCDPDCIVEPSCGDGTLDDGEECDDGNNAPGDGCGADCTIEPSCGDGTLDDGEECDDGNNTPGDGCAADCSEEGGGTGGTAGGGGHAGHGGSGGFGAFGGTGGFGGFPHCSFSSQNLGNQSNSWLIAALALFSGLRITRRNRKR
jgi:cysteine-rich repeat protein